MFKKSLFAGLVSLSFAILAGCGSSNDFQLSPDLEQSSLISASARKNNVRSDWFETLRPDLKAYYAPAQGKTGAALFDALNKIISQNNRIGDYGSTKSFMYSTIDNITVNGKTGLFDDYSYVFIPGSGGNGNSYKEQGDMNKDGVAGDFINCEHTWPQSFFAKKAPMVADLHHMFPTLSVPNEMRNHFAIGMVDGLVPYSTNGGSKLSLIDKTGKNRDIKEMQRILKMPHEQKSVILDNEFVTTFEPGDRQKGNTARALLYFYLRYYNQGIKQGEFESEHFWTSKVSTFIKWSESVDQADQQEGKRNDLIFKKQGNRNPFVDIPQLGSIIGEDVMSSK